LPFASVRYVTLFYSRFPLRTPVGAIAISMQQVIAGMLPIFMLEYAGIDPHILNEPDGLASLFGSFGGGSSSIPSGITSGETSESSGSISSSASSSNPLELLSNLPGAQPLSRINLLVSLSSCGPE
jgi:hypothetical protein